ncbi:MAG: ComEC family competence protein [Eubacterium sp.]|jgi:ComEC/Rec2-related protein|nr:ComEC family competence protein [Eubacterium sp.]
MVGSITDRKAAVMGFAVLLAMIAASFTGHFYCFVLSGFFMLLAAILKAAKKGGYGLAAFAASVGFGLFGFYILMGYLPIINLAGSKLRISGTVKERYYSGNDRSSYLIDADLAGKKARLILYADDKEVSICDIVTFNGKLAALKSKAAFDAENYYYSKGILLSANADSGLEIQKAEFYLPNHYISAFNRQIKSRIMKSLPNDYGAFLSGIFLGDKSDLSPGLNSDVRSTGTSHLTAVSGLHLTVIVHLLMNALNRTPLLRRRFLRYGVLLTATLILIVFFNLSISVVRAGIMMLVFYGGELFLRRGDTLNSLGVAILIIIIPFPFACRDIGLLLSAAGTFGVGVVAPHVIQRLSLSRFNALVKSVAELFLCSVCAYLCTLPLAIVFFEGVSLTAVIINILIQPFFYFGFICMVVFALSGGYLTLFLYAAGFMSKIMVRMIEFFAGFKYGYIPLNYDFILWWLLISVCFIITVSIIFKKSSKTYKAALLSVCMLFFMTVVREYQNYPKTSLEVFSDGVYGAVFLREGDSAAVIATGDNQKIHTRIEEYLKENFLDEAAFLAFTENSEIYEPLSTGYIAYSDEIKDFIYDIDGKFSFYKSDEEYILETGELKISISEISSIMEYSDIKIITGSKQNIPNIPAETIVFLSNRMTSEDENKINAYYDKAKFIFEREYYK